MQAALRSKTKSRNARGVNFINNTPPPAALGMAYRAALSVCCLSARIHAELNKIPPRYGNEVPMGVVGCCRCAPCNESEVRVQRASNEAEMLGGDGEVSLDAWTAELAARLQLDSPYASRQPSVTVEVDPPPSGTAGAPEVLPPPPAAGFPQAAPRRAGPAQKAPPRPRLSRASSAPPFIEHPAPPPSAAGDLMQIMCSSRRLVGGTASSIRREAFAQQAGAGGLQQQARPVYISCVGKGVPLPPD